MTTAERLALHKKEVDSVLRHIHSSSLPRSGPVTTNLKACREALEAGRFTDAKKEALSAMSSVHGLTFIPSSADVIHGIASMYLAAAHHAQGELDDALVHYDEAETHFRHGYDDLNAQVARYSEVLIYTWQSQSVKADEIAASLEAQSGGSPYLAELGWRRKAIKSRLEAEQAAAQAAASAPAARARVSAPPARIRAAGSGVIDAPQPVPDQMIPRTLVYVVLVLSGMVGLAFLLRALPLDPVFQLAPPVVGLSLLVLYVFIERRLKV